MAPDARPEPAVSPFYIPATEAVATGRPHVLKCDDSFALLDTFGNMQGTGHGSEGLFFEDTRYLSRLLLRVAGTRPLLLSSTLNEDNSVVTADLTNPDLIRDGTVAMAKDAIHILSETRLIEAGLVQTLQLRNFGMTGVTIPVDLSFDSDFADIFEVRGTIRAHKGRREADARLPDGTILRYRGLDDVERRTRITFAPAPHEFSPGSAAWTVNLAPGEIFRIETTVRCERSDRAAPATVKPAPSLPKTFRERGADIYSDNESFNDWMSRSRSDLDMLITHTPEGLYAYAGIPWFSTAFGRDGLITALECLWLDPTLAAGTLLFLAARQADSVDPGADAEPGKILHETRKGEMAALGEVPFGRYYGSVDSTPLFVMLAAAYYARTGDLPLIRRIWPAIEAAFGWMATYGDPDGDGFLEYDRRSVNGLVNQGWKDSQDSIFHADGTLAEAPIALVEVQAYAHAAYRGAAGLARALDQHDRAEALTATAETLRQRFEAAFWLEDLGTYALALDRDKRPCRVRTSNAGHALLGGLASTERALSVAENLTSEALFSGWGIRTLAEGEKRYNPLSYHNGSVWPHDNGLIAMGFGHYGLKEPLVRILSALFDASLFTDLHRLPELFCGFTRRPGFGPTDYPVACNPQAWSSAAVFGAFGALLGVSFDAPARRIVFERPTLPPWINRCRIANLRLGDGSVDLLLTRNDRDASFHVVERTGNIEVSLTI